MERRRITHSRRTRSPQRQQQQVGGAAFLDLSDQTKDLLRPVLSGTPLVFLVDPSNTLSPAQKYYTIIQRQDELTSAILKAIHNDLGLSENSSPAEISTALNSKTDAVITVYIDSIRSVRNLIYLKIDPTATGAAANRAKLDDILSVNMSTVTMKKQKLLELLLYPARMTNLFVTAVARLILSLRTDSTAIKEASTPELIGLLAKQYASYVQALSYTETAKELRDYGAAFSLKPAALSVVETFFNEFIQTPATPTAAFKTRSLGYLAALIYHDPTLGWAKAPGSSPLLPPAPSTRITATAAAAAPVPRNEYGLPDAATDNDDLGDGFTFGKFLSWMTPEQMHFAIHLRYAIEIEQRLLSPPSP
jgi:hypothetical protein